MALFSNSCLGTSLERMGFMEGSQKRGKEVVYSSPCPQHPGYFRNPLHLRLQQEENSHPGVSFAMRYKKLPRTFYTGPTLKVAKELLGKYIVRKIGKKKLIGKIIETEAYIGPQDRASHAFGGKVTLRNRAAYFFGGRIYIYLVYGIHWQLNISSSREKKPECVLIRALEVPGESKEIASGPGKLCRYLKLDKSFYGEDLTGSKRIWLEDRGEKARISQITATRRIGIDYAGTYWSRRKWRFLLKPKENSKIKKKKGRA